MGELENEILELFEDDTGTSRSADRNHAGRNQSRSHGHHKRRRQHSHDRYRDSPRRHTHTDNYSGSESNVDMDIGGDDPESEISDIDDRGDSGQSDYGRADDDDQALDEWGPDLMGDSRDRNWLASLNEVERERILAERQEKRDLLMEQRELKLKLKAGNRSIAPGAGASRNAMRPAKDVSGRGGFSDLKRARERRRRGSPGRWSSSGEEAEYSDEDEDSEPLASIDDVNKIMISRNQLEKWIFSPFFNDTVIGCFVRIVTKESDANDYNNGSSSDYKIMEIVDVVNGEANGLPSYSINKTLTDKYLTLKYGSLEKDYSMETISNSPIKPEEFSKWVSVLQSDRIRHHRVTVDGVQQKIEDLNKARNYQLTDADINDMVKERKRLARLGSSGSGALNPAIERAELLQRRIEARQTGDWSKLEEIEARLNELDKLTAQQPAKPEFTGSHKSLLAPSTSSRYGVGESGGNATLAVRRKRLLTPSSSNVSSSSGFASARASAMNRNGSRANDVKPGLQFELVAPIKVQELSLRSKVTPGYVDIMAVNGGRDLSFIKF